MSEVSNWVAELRTTADGVLEQMIEFLPSLVGAALIVLLGWLVAWLLQTATVRSARRLNEAVRARIEADWGHYLTLSSARVALVAKLIFWLVFLIFLAAATQVLGLESFWSWFDQLVAYLPNLVIGILIVVAGLLIGNVARDLTTATLTSAGLSNAELVGRAAQITVLVTATVLGINQVGIDVTLLITLIGILVGGLVGGVALAFALGARSLVGNLIGAHYVRQHYRPGQTVRVGDIEGEIIELSPVFVLLSTPTGRVTIPAKTFMADAATQITDADPDTLDEHEKDGDE